MTELPLDGLPMAELLRKGMTDLQAGKRSSQAALLALIGAPRLTAAGVEALKPYLDTSAVDLESQLFAQILAEMPNRRQAFAQYKSLLDELASLENAAHWRARRMNLFGNNQAGEATIPEASG